MEHDRAEGGDRRVIRVPSKAGRAKKHAAGDIPAVADLQGRYGLTWAEAALAAALVNGARLSEHATERGIAITTARSQLKCCFRKTSTSRQAELVRLILLGGRADRV